MSSIDTMRAWARRLAPGERDAILAELGASELEGLAEGEAFFLPCFSAGRVRDDRAAVLLRHGDRLTLLTRAPRGERAPARVELDLADVHTAEWGTVLLHSWFRLDADGPSGPVALRADFNTVTEGLFRPIVQGWVAGLHAGGRGELARERARLDPLVHTAYKFMNLGREALAPGATLEDFALQPRVTRPWLRVLRRTVVPGALALLTDRALVLTAEGDERGAGEYACLFTWMRRDRIAAIERRDGAVEGVAVASVRMPAGRTVELRHAATEEAVPRLLARTLEPARPALRALA